MRNIPAILAFVLMATQAQSAGLAKSGFIERTITMKNTLASSAETTRLYWEGDNMRIERYSTSGLLVRIKKGQTLYIYMPSEKKAVKTIIPAGHGGTVQQMLEEISGPVKSGKKVGTARILGVDCNVYTAPARGGTAKAYVSTDPRLPAVLKMQETSGAASRTIETKQLKLNYNVPDSMFSLPKGVAVKEEKFPAMPPAGGKKQQEVK